jgi:hypothetical protein
MYIERSKMPVKVSGVVDTEATAELRDRRVDPMTAQRGVLFFSSVTSRDSGKGSVGCFFYNARTKPSNKDRGYRVPKNSAGMRRILAGWTWLIGPVRYLNKNICKVSEGC